MSISSYGFAALFLSLLGLVLFIYGKRAPSLIFGVAGIALMTEPMFVFNPKFLWLWGVGTLAAMVAAQAAAKRGKPQAA